MTLMSSLKQKTANPQDLFGRGTEGTRNSKIRQKSANQRNSFKFTQRHCLMCSFVLKTSFYEKYVSVVYFSESYEIIKLLALCSKNRTKQNSLLNL